MFAAGHIRMRVLFEGGSLSRIYGISFGGKLGPNEMVNGNLSRK